MSSETSTSRSGRARRRAVGPPAARSARGAAAGSLPPEDVASPLPAAGLQPWHLFVVGGLIAASAGALVARSTTPANVVFVCLGILTASAAALALYHTLWPLVGPDRGTGPEVVGGRTRAALEREKFLVLKAIKDVEFDRAMRKISAADSQEMITRLRGRAMRLIRQLDTGSAGYRELIEREVAARLKSAGVQPAGGAGFAPGEVELQARHTGTDDTAPVEQPAAEILCAGCQSINDPDARFCKQCGAKLTILA